jgi:transketolase
VRREFAKLLHQEMGVNNKIWLLTADLGYGMWDKIQDDYPDRFKNVGAAEQMMIGTGVGLALEGKIPSCYSVTSFLLYRPYEWIRNYLDYEDIPVKLLGGGLEEDYGNLGFTHHSNDYKYVLDGWRNICDCTPRNLEELRENFFYFIRNKKPSFMGLRRESH